MAEPMAVLYSRYSIAMAEEIEIEVEQEKEKEKIIVWTFIKNNTNWFICLIYTDT